jgi:hypothetical protein
VAPGPFAAPSLRSGVKNARPNPGTGSSNPFPSAGESANFRSLLCRAHPLSREPRHRGIRPGRSASPAQFRGTLAVGTTAPPAPVTASSIDGPARLPHGEEAIRTDFFPRLNRRRQEVTGERRGDFGQSLSRPSRRGRVMSDTPQLLLAHHLKALKLPTFLREYDKLAQAMRRRGRRPSPLFAAPGRTRTDRPGTADGRAPHRGGTVPDGEKPRQFRLHRDPFAQQDIGPGTRPRRIHCSPRQCDRGRQQRHWERRTLLSGWGWRPVRRACRSASPPRPRWCTR